VKQSGVKGIGIKRRIIEKLDCSEVEMTRVDWNGAREERSRMEWSKAELKYSTRV